METGERSCSSCSNPIPVARLEAQPQTTLCVDCKTEYEKQPKIQIHENPEKVKKTSRIKLHEMLIPLAGEKFTVRELWFKAVNALGLENWIIAHASDREGVKEMDNVKRRIWRLYDVWGHLDVVGERKTQSKGFDFDDLISVNRPSDCEFCKNRGNDR
jgi:hypothetical protein